MYHKKDEDAILFESSVVNSLKFILNHSLS